MIGQHKIGAVAAMCFKAKSSKDDENMSGEFVKFFEGLVDDMTGANNEIVKLSSQVTELRQRLGAQRAEMQKLQQKINNLQNSSSIIVP